MSIELQILKLLSDGQFHSGEALARELDVSRTTVWKATQNVRQEYAVEIQSVKGRGYRLSRSFELLDCSLIKSKLASTAANRIINIDVLPVVDSTNRYLMAAASQGAPSGQFILAEQQTAGRGRLGRLWVSPFGCNLYCSLLWRFELASSVLSGLGIVVAVALATVLAEYVDEIEIKWPNDILHKGQKLAGILLEMQGEANGPAAVVIGMGINVSMPNFAQQQIDQAWTDMQKACGKHVSRNSLSARLIEHLVMAIHKFEKKGLADFVASWSKWDMLRDKHVELVLANQSVAGIARGIDKNGALQLESDGVIKCYMAGEASLKK